MMHSSIEYSMGVCLILNKELGNRSTVINTLTEIWQVHFSKRVAINVIPKIQTDDTIN